MTSPLAVEMSVVREREIMVVVECQVCHSLWPPFLPTVIMSEETESATAYKKRRLRGACDICRHKKSANRIFLIWNVCTKLIFEFANSSM